MELNKDFLQRIKTGKIPMMEVGIIDDNSDVLKARIEGQVFCNVCEYSLKDIIDCSNNEKRRSSLLRHDILFWDASLSDNSGISATSILDILIQSNPKFFDISRVIIGQDIIRYAQSSDMETRTLISRALRLPHIIYGNECGTKVDNMLNYMKRVAINNNIQLPVKLPRGICRKEILDKVEPYLQLVSQNLQAQSRLAWDIDTDFKDFQPMNEEERVLLEIVRKMSSLFEYNQHCIAQFYEIMGLSYHINTRWLQQTITKDGENKKPQGR